MSDTFRRLLLLLLISAAPPVAGEQADFVTQKSGPATLTLEVASAKSLEIPFAPVTLTLRVEGARPLKVMVPRRWAPAKTWVVFPKTNATETALASGQVRWQRTYYLEPLTTGDVDLPFAPIQISEGDRERTITWKPWTVRVLKKVQEADLKQLRGSTGIEDIPPAPSDSTLWPWFLAGALFVVLVAGGLVWWRGGWPLRAMSAEEWALRELDRLTALKLPERGEVERFHTLLSNRVRHFVERQFHVRARRQTTPEFLTAMTQDARFTAAQQEFLRDFLQRCDLSKFSGVAVAPAACHALTDRAREFVKQSVLVSLRETNPSRGA